MLPMSGNTLIFSIKRIMFALFGSQIDPSPLLSSSSYPTKQSGGRMDLVSRAKNIIMSPKTEWPVIAGEEPNVGKIFTGYVLPLALIPTIASILGFGLFSFGARGSFAWGIAMGLVQLITAFFGVYVTAFVIDLLAPNFGSQKNLGRSVQLVAYSYTPVWVAGVFLIIPIIGWLAGLAGLYGLYLLYIGIPHMMKTPQDKVVIYMVVSVLVLLVVYFLVSAILSTIFLGIFGLGTVATMRGF